MNSCFNPWDENAAYRQKELESRGDRTYWELLVPLFRDDIKKIASECNVLDVGCGLGFLTKEIANYVKNIIGIDASSRSIEYAKRDFANNIEFCNLSILDFQKENSNLQFNICIANMVFHNISNLEENINAISKLLVKNGYLIFSIPHPAFWYSTRKYIKSDIFEYDKEEEYEVPFKIQGHAEHPYRISYYHRSIDRYSKILQMNNFEITRQKEPFLAPLDKNKKKVKDILYYICRLK
ncbi:MAG: class I SAM-dependent methyltransferase [Treponema sp.]|nr:class I SAM-dependent methyltransferase [Treponema sp.]